MTNPHLTAALEKHQALMAAREHRGYKRDYVQQHLPQILELVGAGVPQDNILSAFEQDGVRISRRYFSRLMSKVRQYGHL